MKRLLFSMFLLLLLASFTFAEERGLLPADYYKEINFGNPVVSPDGKHLIFEKTIVLEESNSRLTTLWLVDLIKGKFASDPVQISSNQFSSRNAVWSPDGKTISFVSRRKGETNPIWFLEIGLPGEAFHIEGVQGSPVWSPDGKLICYLKRVKPEESGKRAGWIAPDAISRTLDADRMDGRVITRHKYKANGVHQFLPHPDSNGIQQIFVVSAKGGEARQITNNNYDVLGVRWAGDSKRLYFTADPDQKNESREFPTTNIYMANLESVTSNLVYKGTGKISGFDINRNNEQIALTQKNGPNEQTDIYLVNGNEVSNLTAKWDYSPGNPSWSVDGGKIYFRSFYHATSQIFSVSVNSEIKQLTKEEEFIWAADYFGKELAIASTNNPLAPGQLKLYDLATGNSSILMDCNQKWLKEIKLNAPEKITWAVEDGTKVEGWVIKPVGYQTGKSYPMVMKIHGGPHWLYGQYWFSTFHVLSNSGFFVFYPNPRGSASYGHDFEISTIGKWGLMDEEDFVKGVQAVLSKYPDVDPERVGVSGGSYGGFMSNWLTARTNMFAASVTSRSISIMENLFSMADLGYWVKFEMGGFPWEIPDGYRKYSPYTYIHNVKAPTLVIHSDKDFRTPIGDGEQWYQTLKILDVPTELVIYPRSDHNLSRRGEPWLLVDRLERIKSWFRYWLINKKRK